MKEKRKEDQYLYILTTLINLTYLYPYGLMSI